MTIQWFPGHMAKAKREVATSLKLVDVVIEIVDARLPDSSRNPMMIEVVRQKPAVIVLGKADLADPQVTKVYVDAWEHSLKAPVVAVDNLHGNSMNRVIDAAKRATSERFAAMAKRGIKRTAIRAMVVGIPNVGKSSFINRLAGRSAAKTGDKPGVTKQQQWIKVAQSMELLDTPGILWPKFDDRHVALHLAWSGAIKSTILEPQELAQELLVWFCRQYPENLFQRFDFLERTDSASDMLVKIAQRRVALKAQGEPDVDRAAELLLREVQTGALGRLTFDRLNDHGSDYHGR